eukprot:3147454-Alexandrium_andersonii.AAC.1
MFAVIRHHPELFFDELPVAHRLREGNFEAAGQGGPRHAVPPRPWVPQFALVVAGRELAPRHALEGPRDHAVDVVLRG